MSRKHINNYVISDYIIKRILFLANNKDNDNEFMQRVEELLHMYKVMSWASKEYSFEENHLKKE